MAGILLRMLSSVMCMLLMVSSLEPSCGTIVHFSVRISWHPGRVHGHSRAIPGTLVPSPGLLNRAPDGLWGSGKGPRDAKKFPR